MRRPLAVILVICWLAMVPDARAARPLSGLKVNPASRIEIKITNTLDDIPPLGFLTLVVEISNNSGADREWKMRSHHVLGERTSMNSQRGFRVPAGEKRTFEWLVPLASQNSDMSRYSNLDISVDGYGIGSGEAREYSSGGGRTPTPYTGMGKALSVKHWAALREVYDQGKTESLTGSPLDPDLMPSDWRGLSGFDVVILTDSEWRGLEPGPRLALTDWISQGGVFFLSTVEGLDSADLPAEGALGAGLIRHFTLEGDIPSRLQGLIKSPKIRSQTTLQRGYSWNGAMANRVGRATPPQALIIAFVLGFAVLIGPINFLVFAPAGNRHRLFWTTPLISVVASLLMGGLIVMSEGFGGKGERFLLMMNRPDARKTVVWQEQVSRTGVLTSNAFQIAQPSVMSPIELSKDDAGRPGSGRGNSYSLDSMAKEQAYGDWFRSRSTQAQLLVAIHESRERVEISKDPQGTPFAQSSFAGTLEDFWYFDGDGDFWNVASIKPGEKARLQPASADDFKVWWTKCLTNAGPVASSRAASFLNSGKMNKFFAKTKEGALSTLPSIRWGGDTGLLMGVPAQ